MTVTGPKNASQFHFRSGCTYGHLPTSL